ncbi:uncharacterized protein LOC119353254 isoform X1 [Triticum dicoccoides]|uniref:uncharacterized protein LOC119353254 isoform X1 n=1 Tax=Triticum dicoccoides TaxID=85692 RepID=UPI0018908458|nr:uncharacterized protein LOC119353254 isoform X1 [Triticum dicoccoides]
MLATGISRHFTSCIAQTGGISLQREDRQHPRGRGVVPAHCSQRTGAHARLHMHRSRQTGFSFKLCHCRRPRWEKFYRSLVTNSVCNVSEGTRISPDIFLNGWLLTKFRYMEFRDQFCNFFFAGISSAT